MNRKQLEHAIRAACTVADDSEVYVIGSQSILGQHPDAPDSLLFSMELDVCPKNKPEAWEAIDGALGELSPFHETFSYYVQGLEIETATLPDGWVTRCIPVDGGSGKIGWCLEVHDLALSKIVAYREKDRDFVRTLLAEKLVDPDVLRQRLPSLAFKNEEHRKIIESWLRTTIADLADE